MRDDVGVACTVEGDGAVNLGEQTGHLFGEPLAADAAALFAPEEDEVAGHAHLDHVCEQSTAAAVISAKSCAFVSPPELAIHANGVWSAR